jgi:hypothetical protein
MQQQHRPLLLAGSSHGRGTPQYILKQIHHSHPTSLTASLCDTSLPIRCTCDTRTHLVRAERDSHTLGPIINHHASCIDYVSSGNSRVIDRSRISYGRGCWHLPDRTPLRFGTKTAPKYLGNWCGARPPTTS